MIKEWISLVVERDRLLREQVDKVILIKLDVDVMRKASNVLLNLMLMVKGAIFMFCVYIQERSEEKNEYFRRLKQFLKDEPPLGDASEEVDIRDTLLSLEKHVSQYCRKHQITSPPASKVQAVLLGNNGIHVLVLLPGCWLVAVLNCQMYMYMYSTHGIVL